MCLGIICFVCKQIDLRKESTIQFVAPSSYPVITFGPFASPTAVLISLSKAIGNFLIKLNNNYCSCMEIMHLHFARGIQHTEILCNYFCL